MWGSDRLQNLAQSDIRSMTAESLKRNAINLSQGLCEIQAPTSVIEGARQALLEQKKNTYSPAEGLLSLRQKISLKLHRENNIYADPETEIIVVCGATGGFAATLMALLNPGDGLLLFEPFYGYHSNAARLAQIEPQVVPFWGGSTTITEDTILSALKPNTKAIVICTPANPSGKMWSRSELEVICQVANKHNLLVMTDEMYEYFRYDNREHISPASLPQLRNRTVTLMGLSKTFSITGWRLGYVAAPFELAQKIRLVQDLFYVCAPTPLQYGVEAGLDMDPSYYAHLRGDFQRRRDLMVSSLQKAGLEPMIPEGAYYILADFKKVSNLDSKSFAMLFLDKIGVATVPGRSFFTEGRGENYIRLHFAVENEYLLEACRRITEFKI